MSFSGILYADASQIGTTANNFIKILVPAKPAAMGEAYVATADDINSLSYNPAGISKCLINEISFTHIEWFQQIRYEQLNMVMPMSIGTFGVSLNWLNVSQMDKTIANPLDPHGWQKLYSFSPWGINIQLTYANTFTDSLSMGANIKIIDNVIDQNDPLGSAASFLFDIGCIYDIKALNGLSAGLVVKNIGTQTTFFGNSSSQALDFKGGLGYNNGIFQAEVDAEYYNDNAINYYAGAGWTLFDTLTLRAGYKGGTLPGYTAGAGFAYGLLNVDYAFVPYQDSLGYTNRITASFRFGSPEVKLKVYPAVFSPNADRYLDYAYFNFSARRENLVKKAFITIKNSFGKIEKIIPVKDIALGKAYWDGKDSLGLMAVEDGDYKAVLSVDYGKGIKSDSEEAVVTVDNTPPNISLLAYPRVVQPNDNDLLKAPVTFSPTVYDLHGIAQWKLIIKSPDGKVFRTLAGSGSPNPVIWDGTSDFGEPVKTNAIYTYTYYAADTVGNWGATKPEAVRVLFKEIVINLSSDTLFDPGKADVKISVYNDIKPIVELIKKYAKIVVIVEGHTDNEQIKYSKDFPDNITLSKARAEAVIVFFSEVFGLDKNIFQAVGLGETQPVATNDTPEGRKLNRRVTLRLRGVEYK